MIVILTMSSVTTVIEGDITLGIADPVSAGPDLPEVEIEEVIETAAEEDAILDHHVTIEEMIAGDVRIGILDHQRDPMIILMITIENATIPQKKGGVIIGEDLREMIVVAGEIATTLGQDHLIAVRAEIEEISIEMTLEKEGLETINPQKKILSEVKKKKENLVKTNK